MQKAETKAAVRLDFSSGWTTRVLLWGHVLLDWAHCAQKVRMRNHETSVTLFYKEIFFTYFTKYSFLLYDSNPISFLRLWATLELNNQKILKLRIWTAIKKKRKRWMILSKRSVTVNLVMVNSAILYILIIFFPRRTTFV